MLGQRWQVPPEPTVGAAMWHSADQHFHNWLTLLVGAAAVVVVVQEYANLFNAVQGFDGWMAANLPVMK